MSRARTSVQALAVAAAFGFQVLIPQYMQRVLGYDPAERGRRDAAGRRGDRRRCRSALSARLNGRFGPRPMLVAGLEPGRRRAGAADPAAGRRRVRG